MLIFGGLIALTTLAYYTNIFNAVLSFWVAYILTRPLGASIGDFLTQAPKDGGLGLSDSWVNGAFFATIIILIAYLTFTRVDRPKNSEDKATIDYWDNNDGAPASVVELE